MQVQVMQVNIGAMQEFHVQITVCVACSVHLVQHIYVRKHKMKLTFIFPIGHLGFVTYTNYILISFS